MKQLIVCILAIYIANTCAAATVDTIWVESTSMQKTIPNLIITPDSYDTKKDFPVVYLLHGAGGNFSNWAHIAPEILTFADQFNMIIICPDGGVTSWYFDSPIDSNMRYETFITKELLPWVDNHYKTAKDRTKRAISGLSMGGHGAFYLAFRHQELWGAAGSTSGGVDIRPFPRNWDMAKRLGSYAAYPENWEQNTIINMLHLLDGQSLKLIFDCGVNDFFYVVNKNLHQKMLERNIPHEYTERPGAHNREYWRNAIQYHLLFFHNFFQEP